MKWIKNKYGIILLIASIILFCYWQNNKITITDIEFQHDDIPAEFDDYKIVQLSDLHNKRFGSKQSKLLDRISDLKPDIVVVTGDMIDSPKKEYAIEFFEGVVNIAPVFYVSGNHEVWTGIFDDFLKQISDLGVIIMDNEKEEITKEKSSIELLGVPDPDLTSANTTSDNLLVNLSMEEKLEALVGKDTSSFQMLLSHRPELIKTYAKYQIDLVFTGHAHGGQFRIPSIGGFVAPDQGLFPKYTSGIHRKVNTWEIVNRGLGNSIIPIRIFNQPEIVSVTLKAR